MKDLMKDIFPFDEDNPIQLQLTLFLRDSKDSVRQNALITFDESKITLSTHIGQNVDRKGRICYNQSFSKKDISLKNSKVRNLDINVTKQQIEFTRFQTVIGKSCICSLNLKKLEYKLSKESSINYYRLSNNAQFFEGYLNSLTVKYGEVVGWEACPYDFSLYGSYDYVLFHDDNRIFLKTNSDPRPFLAIASFFSCSPIEILMENKSGKVSVFEPHYSAWPKVKGNQQLTYLFSNGICLDYFRDFISLLSNVDLPQNIENIYTYIEYYVRAEYLDTISKLIIYTSILENLSGVEIKDDTYGVIKKYLESEHISINKINCSVDSEIKDNQNISIGNFVQLRNFFIHHFENKKAKEFLLNSDLLFNLKMAITIILLKKLGVANIHFDKYFHHLSIFDDSYKEENNISKLFYSKE